MRAFYFCAIGSVVVLFSSCGQFIYKSPTVRTPLLSKQHDLNAQLNVSSAGGEVYAAYAVLDNLGVSAGYSGYRSNQTSDSTKVYNQVTNFRDFDFGLIPFYANNNLRFEMPLGIGITRRKSSDYSYIPYNPYTRYYAQPTFGMSWDEIEFALFVRVSNLYYTNKQLGNDLRYEPGFMVRGGHKNFKAMFQFRTDVGTNFSKTTASNLSINQQVEYFPFHVSFGLSFGINVQQKIAQ